MSQISIPTNSSGSVPKGTASSDKSSRESLHNYLVEAARTMRRVELGVGITGWLCVLVIFLLSAILVDHWLWPLNAFARFAVLTFLVGWTVWWVPTRILPLLFQSIHPEHAARKIERQHPEIKESLISWLQLSTSTEHPAPRGVLATVGRFAVRNLGGQDSTSIIDSANFIRLGALLFGFLLTGTVYLFVSPKSGTTSIARMLMPWSNIAPAARVRIINVTPGTAKITQGTSLPISVTVRGMLKADQVFVRYDLADGQQVGQRLKLNEDIEGVNYRLDFGKSFGGIHQALKYWIDAGDASAGPFELSVQVVPIVAIDRLELQYPKYTKLKSRTIQQDGAIEAPEGTRVSLFAHSNQPMIKSRLEFDPEVGNGVLLSSSQIIDLETQETQLHGGWLLTLDKKGTNPTLSTYRVKATNALNESNGDPVIYKTKVLGDLPPTVTLKDINASILVPINGSRDIEIYASDPDFGLVSIVASAKKTDGKNLFETECFQSREGTTAQVIKVFTFSPSEYELKVGDELEFRATATDNRCKPGDETPEPNQTNSTVVRIKIVADPVKVPGAETPKPEDKKEIKPEDKKSAKGNSGNKTNKDNQPSNYGDKSETPKEDAGEKKPNPQDQKTDKPKENKDNKDSTKQENDKKNKSKDKGSGQGESGSGGEPSESEDSDQAEGSGNQKSDGKSKGSKSNSSKDDSNSASSDSDNDADPSDPADGTDSQPSKGSKSGKQSSKSQKKDWTKPENDAEAFDLIDELRKEQEQQPGEKQPGEKQPGEKQPGEKQPGEKQPGEKQPGDKQPGEKQPGEKQPGEKQPGEKQPGEKQPGEKQPGEKQPGEKQPGEKQPGEKQPGEKQPGEKQPGEKQPGEKQPGEKQPGEKQPGEKQPGEKQPGESSGSAKPGVNNEGASNASSASKAGGDQSDDKADSANKEYADKLTDLALDYLKQQKDQPDPELLKRLNWSKEDLQRFLDRWENAKEFAKTDPNKKREVDATLKMLSKRQSKSTDQSVKDRDDDLKGYLEEGARVRPPEALRSPFEQFRKAVGRQ